MPDQPPDLAARLEEANRAIEEAPENARVYYNRGLILAELDEYARALADFQRALAIEPNAERHYRCGLMYSVQQLYVEALSHLDQAITLDPRFALARIERGLIYAGVERYDQAMLDLRLVILEYPHYPDGWITRARVHLLRGYWYEVIADAERAIELDPKNSLAYQLRGMGYKAIRRNEQAVADLRTFLELSPQAPEREEIRKMIEQIEQQPQSTPRHWLARLLGR